MLNTRQKCLFYFLKQADRCSKLKLAKIFFLMGQEGRLNKGFKFYSFVPYKFGPYSFELFHDLYRLEQENMLATNDNTVIYQDGNVDISSELSLVLDYYLAEPFTLNDKELMDYVYKNYPRYTIFSEIKRKKRYIRDRTGVYTIGYEGRSIDEFIMKLVQEKIQVLADVRDNPWSMKFGYKKHALQSFCGGLGIEYIGYPDLGIPGSFREKLKTKKDYDALFKRYKAFIVKKEGQLNTLKNMATKKRIALMCFEKDPKYCHRTIIAKKLAGMGAEVEIQ